MNKINELFGKDINVVNVGIESFYNSLRDQKVDTVQVDWKPAAGGNEKLVSILDKLKR
ncbi:MAG TPA: fdrA domain protein [Clostridiaceae bacterium]|nr:fdrA domain protein [Clostridiaceae bacterium]